MCLIDLCVEAARNVESLGQIDGQFEDSVARSIPSASKAF
jgi:hypothetical protein